MEPIQPPELVKHTVTIPSIVRKEPEDKPGILDGMWACLLNDYLDTLVDLSDDESNSDPSDADDNSVSTAVLLAEKRRLRSLKKKEKRKNRLKALALQDIAEASDPEHSPEEAYQLLQQSQSKSRNEKNSLHDGVSTSRRSERTMRFKKVRDKYETNTAAPWVKGSSNERRLRSLRKALDPDATEEHLSVHDEMDGRSLAASLDVRSRISRLRKEAEMEAETEWGAEAKTRKRHEPLGDRSRRSYRSRSRSRLIQPEGRINNDIVLKAGSQDNPIDIVSGTENRSWHSRRELFSSDIDRLPKKKDPTPNIELIPKNQEKTPGERDPFYSADLRDDEEDVWALDENKRSELEEIRQKKLDRQQALDRIRAIKARMARLEK
jgi:hypothetical protein